MVWETLPVVLQVLGGLHKGPVGVRESHPEVWEGLGSPRGDPAGIKRLSIGPRGVRRPFRRSGRSRESLPESRAGSIDRP